MAELNGRAVRVVGYFRLGADLALDGNVIVSRRSFFEIFPDAEPGMVNFGLIRLKPGADVLRVRDALRKQLPNDVLVITKQKYFDWVTEIFNNNGVGFLFHLPSAVGFLIGIICCYQILHTDITEKYPQYATLKAIGYGRFYFVRLVLFQALVLAIMGFLLGTVAAMVLFHVMRDTSHVIMYLNASRAATVLIATVIMCEVAGLIALYKVVSADPAECF